MKLLVFNILAVFIMLDINFINGMMLCGWKKQLVMKMMSNLSFLFHP